MNIQPPIGISFHAYSDIQVSAARLGICPHCSTKTLEAKHKCEAIQFWQCKNCEVVVALEKT